MPTLRTLLASPVIVFDHSVNVELEQSFSRDVNAQRRSFGIKGEPTIVRPEKDRKSVLDLLFGDASEYLPDPARLMQTNAGFYYLWK